MSVGVLAVGIMVAQAALTFNATSVTSDVALTLKSAAGSAILVGHEDQTAAITVGSSTAAFTLDLGKGVAGNTVSVANSVNTSAQTVNVANGASAANSTVKVLSGAGTAGAGVLNLGDNPRVTTISIGNGAVHNALTINMASAVNATSTTVNIGTGANTAAAEVKVLSGNTSGAAQTLSLATGDTAGASTKVVNIGTGATATSTVAIGNSNADTTIALTGGDDWSINAAGAGTLVSLNLGTTALLDVISATTSLNFGLPVGGVCQEQDKAITGAATGTTVIANPVNFNLAANHTIIAFASSTGFVTIRDCMATSTQSDPDGGIGAPQYRVTVFQF